ncbi:MAG: hypothetical protein DRJ07_01765 [Bacteroidetes bacterium]|nr:MAG: hypothetical protein DRJ07_01765 [Bacteroidota bacterium]
MNLYTINRGVSKRLHIYFSNRSRKKMYHDKINNLVKEFKPKPLSNNQISEIKEYYASFGFNDVKTCWHRYCTHISGEFHKEYIPEDIFYNLIEPRLNMYKMHPALTDKNLLSRLFSNVKQPEIIIKNLNGCYYDGEDNRLIQIEEVINKCKKYSKLVIKPSIDSGGGKNVIVFALKGDKTDYNNLSIKDFLKLYDKNFSIQGFIRQNRQMNLLNPSSVNTLRIVSLLMDNEVDILTSVCRIGAIGGKIDNISQGGLACRISSNGLLSEKGYLKSGRSVLETGTEIKLKDFKIPNFNKIIKEVQSLHKQIPYFKLISWDLAIDDKGEIILIEYNVRSQEILGLQFFNGPLFGVHTDKILSSCDLNGKA